MLFAGVRQTIRFEEASETIPRVWAGFSAAPPLPGRLGETAYGALCGADMAGGTFEYICAKEVESFDGLPAEVGRMRVPAARYAVFVHHGPTDGIRETIEAAYGWLAANSDWQDGGTPSFERYGPGFDPATGAGTEVWAPVVPRA